MPPTVARPHLFNAASSTQEPYPQVLAGLTFASLCDTIAQTELGAACSPCVDGGRRERRVVAAAPLSENVRADRNY